MEVSSYEIGAYVDSMSQKRGLENKSKKEKDKDKNKIERNKVAKTGKKEIPFTQVMGNFVRIHKKVFNISDAAKLAGVNKDDYCWQVALSLKTDVKARNNCDKPNCKDPPGTGRHQRLFANADLNPNDVLDAKKSTAFFKKFADENLKFPSFQKG